MSFNVTGAVEVPLSVFGGLVTEMSPNDLPGGVSPDCQDVVFVPGAVSSRPGLQRVFVTALGGSTSVAYAKSCVFPNGNIRNLYLTNAGQLYSEDPVGSPGIATLLLQSTPGSYAKSVTAFGREYIAISDGLHGSDVPLQWDGTNLDRVTQDGPGAPPTVSNFWLPPFPMQATPTASPMTITTADPTNGNGTYFAAFNVNVVALTTLNVGDSVVITGNSCAALNGTWTVINIFSSTYFKISGYWPNGTSAGAGGTVTPNTGGTTIIRNNNIVTIKGVVGSTQNNLKPGFRVQISGIPAADIGGGINQIVINNEDLPGLATVETNNPHGLVQGVSVSLQGIASAGVGGTISSATRAGGISTITMSGTFNLSPGSSVTIAGVTDASFNTTIQVLQVVSAHSFTFDQAGAVDATSSGGTVKLNWPIPNTPTPSYFEVQSAPTTTTFQVAISYSDGTWTGGTVTYAWDGFFFVVTATPDTFTYQQYGPNASSTVVGTVTPSGQISPGQHQMRVAFLTRQGYITRPSPPITFIANGGQYLLVDNVPIGPPNVAARILEFTGTNGAYFFYIPVPAMVNGQQVSTSTVINDNSFGSAIIDFSDNTLYAATGTSIPGNDLAAQIVIDGALGFGYFASRLLTYGQRNRVQNLLNLGFDGGASAAAPTIPLGWVVDEPSGTLATGHYGQAWQMNVSPGANRGQLHQSLFLDAYGAPIATSNTRYKVRFWAAASAADADASISFVISSDSTSFNTSVTVAASALATTGSWVEATFGAKTPSSIPSDLQFFVFSASTISTLTITVDEISLVYADNPYLDTLAYASYVNNPEAFDGVTGKFGPAEDTRKILDFGLIRDNLYVLTQEPSGRLHQTSNNGATEPAGWTVSEVGANCGLLSAFALAKSQADDATASGGEEWLIWGSSSGTRMFGGDQPWKISQEIQPDWDSINPAALGTVWALNDPVNRVVYFGLPTGTHTTPNLIYPMNYRELDTPYQISQAPPVRTNFSGRLIATDNTRKWTRWNIAARGAALMYRNASQASFVILGGSFGNVYTLNPAKYTDDDYGLIASHYDTYYFVGHEEEMAMQLGAHRKMLAYFQSNVLGLGVLTVSVFANTASNVWPFTCVRTLTDDPKFDLEWAGGSVTAQRMAFRFASSPATGTDNWFSLQKVIATLRPNARLPVRGSAS